VLEERRGEESKGSFSWLMRWKGGEERGKKNVRSYPGDQSLLVLKLVVLSSCSSRFNTELVVVVQERGRSDSSFLPSLSAHSRTKIALWLHLLHLITPSEMIHRMELVQSNSPISLFNPPNFPFSPFLNQTSTLSFFLSSHCHFECELIRKERVIELQTSWI